MPDYDFKSLSPLDFENLTRDLLQASLGVSFESFKSGRDGGVDLRHSIDASNNWVVQCKHYANSNFAQLKWKLLNEELPKVRKLSPARYIVVTSLKLSKTETDLLYDIFKDFADSPKDIIGGSSLNGLLSNHPEVERANYKLWICSTEVIHQVVNSDVFQRSQMTREQITRELAKYVETPAFSQAFEKLEVNKTLVLSGAPGVGKTTLAKMLLAKYLRDGWEVVSVSSSINEALKAYDRNKKVKQVVYYDDFLGQISFGDKLNKNEDRTIFELIESIERTSGRRFILTTRDYILTQATRTYEHFARNITSVEKYTLALEAYSDLDKANILYNHLYFSTLPAEHVESFVTTRTYRGVVRHKNYNPRLIDWATKARNASEHSSADYPAFFLRTLDNPELVWSHAFEYQLSTESRLILLILATCPDRVRVEDVRKAFDYYCECNGRDTSSNRDFNDSVRELEGNFLSVTRFPSGTILEFENPSIADFISNYLKENLDEAELLFHSVFYFEQVAMLDALLLSNPNSEFAKLLRGNQEKIVTRVQEVIGRPTIRVWTSSNDVHTFSNNLAKRIVECSQLSETLESELLSAYVATLIVDYINNLDVQLPWVTRVVDVIELVESEGRFAEQEKERLLGLGTTYLLREPSAFDEALAAAEWLGAHSDLVGEDALENYVEIVDGWLGAEIYSIASEYEDLDELHSAIRDMDEIAKHLDADFSEHESWAREKATELSLQNGEETHHSDYLRGMDEPEEAELGDSEMDDLFTPLVESD